MEESSPIYGTSHVKVYALKRFLLPKGKQKHTWTIHILNEMCVCVCVWERERERERERRGKWKELSRAKYHQKPRKIVPLQECDGLNCENGRKPTRE